MPILVANTSLDKNLHIVDFSKASPDTLLTSIKESIEQLNDQLDTLEVSSDINITSEQALANILDFEYIGAKLDRSWGILSHLNSVMSNDDIRHVHRDALPILSAYSTRLGQHKGLFNSYKLVCDDKLLFDSLTQSRKREIELAIRSFQLSGVALPIKEQQRYGEIQNELSLLTAKFSDNILDATQVFSLVLNEEQLSGITNSGLALLSNAGEQYRAKLLSEASDDQREALQASLNGLSTYKDEKHQGKLYVATLDFPVYSAIMTYGDNRNLRETLYKAFVTRASEHDIHTNGKGEVLNNAENMTKIMALREQKAKILGFDDYSQVSLATKMADTKEQVEKFLRELAEKAMSFAKKDLDDLTSKAIELGVITDDEFIRPWDIGYVAEKLKQDAFSLSQEDIRPYFPLPKVIEGLFTVVNRLFGVKAVECTDVPLWHEDVKFYQLYDADDSLIGAFYFDLFARQGKRGGAWMSGFQSKYVNEEKDYQQLPVCFMVGNFTPPITENNVQKPSLLTHNEVVTLFHEFGHGLHHLLTEVTVTGTSGINGVEWDAVELPSQFLENWTWNSESIALISGHVDTGEPLPEDKLKALLDAKNFQSGMQTLRQIEFALFDLLAHSRIPAPDYQELQNVLNTVRSDVAVMETPDYNRFANGFSHIFAGGYACGYFSYKWAELFSADAFSKFEEEGIFNAETGKAFRENILAVGGSRPAKKNFENFRGREANVDALIRHSGFA